MSCKGDILYLYCTTCMTKKKSKHKSPEEFSRLALARTPYGLLIWCNRCDEEVAHFPYNWEEIDRQNPSICHCEGCKNKN